jgi:hypothetical protein
MRLRVAAGSIRDIYLEQIGREVSSATSVGILAGLQTGAGTKNTSTGACHDAAGELPQGGVWVPKTGERASIGLSMSD